RHAPGERHAGDAADARGASEHRIRTLVVVQVEENAPGELAQSHRSEVADGALEVARELPEKERPVAALQADLVVGHDDRGAEPRQGPQYTAPGNVVTPAVRPGTRYIFTPVGPWANGSPRMPSWIAQLRPRTLPAKSGRRNGVEPSRRAQRAPLGPKPAWIWSIRSRPMK